MVDRTGYYVDLERVGVVKAWLDRNGGWGVLASDGETVLALAAEWQGKTFAQVRKAVGEAAWRAAISDIPVEGSSVSMADAGGGGLEDARAAEADWICEGCPFRRGGPAADGCREGAYCVHETGCSRRGKIGRGELCTAGFWALLPSWGRDLPEGAKRVLGRVYLTAGTKDGSQAGAESEK